MDSFLLLYWLFICCFIVFRYYLIVIRLYLGGCVELRV